MHYIYLAVGLLIGGVIVWLLMKGKLALAEANGRAVGAVERASLSEQLKAATQELSSVKTHLTNLDARAKELQAELNEQNQEGARLSERAGRLASMEEAQQNAGEEIEKLKTQVADLREANGRLTADVAAKDKRLSEWQTTQSELTNERDDLQQENAEFKGTIVELKSILDQERKQTVEKIKLLCDAREQLTNQFKSLANDILDYKSKKFTEQNQTNLNTLLNPLKQQITDFKAKVEEVYVNEGKDRTALAEQVKQLMQLNNTLSQDAQNLTLALKGNRKAQGNWGEIILEDPP